MRKARMAELGELHQSSLDRRNAYSVSCHPTQQARLAESRTFRAQSATDPVTFKTINARMAESG